MNDYPRYYDSFVYSGILKFFNTCVQFFPSLLIARILKKISLLSAAKSSASRDLVRSLQKESVVLSLCLFFFLCSKTLLENRYFYVVTKMGASIRAALSTAVYKKSLKLSPTGRQNITGGEIINLMQLDVARLEDVATSIHILWDGILQVVGYTSLLIYFLGPSVFAGIAVMLIVIPLQTIFFKKLSALRTSMASFTDSRVKLTNEILQGIRAIKSYNWEEYFKSNLLAIRQKELKVLMTSAKIRAILVSVLSAAPSFVAVVTLAVYAFLGNDLSPAKVFTALALFNQLRFPLIFYPMLLNTLAEGRVSLDRLSNYFASDEIENYVVNSTENSNSLEIINGNFSWISGSNETRGLLKNVNISIAKGDLVAIVGPVGSGKTTLLNAFIGDLHLLNGEVKVNGTIGYVSQSAWIPNENFKNVITFGNQFNQTLYDQVIEACCLEKDIALLENGDKTEIGERGVNLSGGQKQRASLARALYENVDIYILDDPLSALDNNVGSQVFKKCIKEYLKDKTRILVTHQLNILNEVDYIIIMDKDADGSCYIKDQGRLSDFLARGFDFSNLQSKVYSEETPEKPKEDNDSLDNPHSPSDASYEVKDDDNSIYVEPELPGAICDEPDISKVNIPIIDKKLIVEEERAEGSVDLQVYNSYIKAGNKPKLIAITLISFVLANFCQISQQWVVAAWTSDRLYEKRSLSAYLCGVSLMATGVALFNYFRTFVGCLFGIAASETLHFNMISRILRAPLSYFESTPMGRILQRFSKDLDSIDQQLPSSLGQFIASALQILGSMFAIISISPWFSVVSIPLFTIYIKVTNYYRSVARELKRLDSISRSPIFSHFSESLGGVSLIRAFKRVPSYLYGNEYRVSNNIAVFNTRKLIDRWLSVRLELLGNIIVLASALLVIASGSNAGPAGISLNNALGVTSLLNWAVRNIAETESMMTSVERVLYTTDSTPSESPSFLNYTMSNVINNSGLPLMPGNDTQLLSSGWPWKGGIILNGLKMRYRSDFDQVLKGVSLNINPGEHVGIIGRTGSGKSSIYRALLRLTEPESGKIFIDGVDISRIGLDALRSGISIIPQDPVLFSGSIRSNLDPFSKLPDFDLWMALKKVNLHDTVSHLPGELSYMISESGENFSIGQRQLICLARALLRRSKLLLLDEATSSVDFETDSLIQKTIKEEFKSSTILIIAHRLNNVLDSDRILVMDAGRVVEFDTPQNQLKNPNSILNKLLKAGM